MISAAARASAAASSFPPAALGEVEIDNDNSCGHRFFVRCFDFHLSLSISRYQAARSSQNHPPTTTNTFFGIMVSYYFLRFHMAVFHHRRVPDQNQVKILRVIFFVE